ncbi:MAG: hypothetical protein ACOVP4_00365 [Bacteriovoracaceae bacterium]
MLDINSQINALAEKLNLTKSEIVEMACISSFNRRKVKDDFSKASITSLIKLADNLEVNFESLVEGKIDYTALKEHHLGNKMFIPLKYQNYMKSKISTINNALSIGERYLSSGQINCIKKKLQINDDILKEESLSISGLLLIDIFSEIQKYQPDKGIFYHIGSSLCLSHMGDALKDFDKESLSSVKTVERFIENIHSSVEYNMEYKILDTNQKFFVVAANTRTQAKDHFKLRQFGTNPHYQNIIGYYNQISHTILNAPAKITRLSSWKGQTAELVFSLQFQNL